MESLSTAPSRASALPRLPAQAMRLRDLPADHPVRALGAHVARLDLEGAGCTAVLFADLLITNRHCIPDDGPIERLLLGYEGVAEPHFVSVGGAPVELNWALDFAILPLPAGTRPHPVRFSTRPLRSGERLLILQHPRGEPMWVTECVFEGVGSAPRHIRPHYGDGCEARPGSSGSPVFDAQGTLVGLLHSGREGVGRAGFTSFWDVFVHSRPLRERLPEHPLTPLEPSVIHSLEGWVYRGEELAGVREGWGRYEAGDWTYEGWFVDGERNGLGRTLYHDTGVEFRGEYRDGERHGRGSTRFSNGERFEGLFEEGRPTRGVFVEANGRRTQARIRRQGGEWALGPGRPLGSD